MFVGADRHIVEGNIRDHGERVVEGLVSLADIFFQGLHDRLEIGDLGHQPLRRLLVLLPLRLADLLRSGIATGLHVLELADGGAARLVECNQFCGLRTGAPFFERLVERLRVLADPFDIEHGGLESFSWVLG